MIKFNKVTWYSKLASIIFFIGVLPVLTFYIGTQVKNDKAESSVLIQPVQDDIISSFENSPYRVVKIFDSKDYPNQIYIATQKSEAKCGSSSGPLRCTDDSLCGSVYSSPTCFFFTEPKFWIGANAKSTYIGSLDKQGGIEYDTMIIKDKNLFFKTSDGDEGIGFEKEWKLDLNTGKFDLLKESKYSNPHDGY